MGGNWSSQVDGDNSKIPDLGDDELSWKEHPECTKLVERLRQESSAIRELNDKQMGNLLICAQSCDAGPDSRKLAEVCIDIAQAESSAMNISSENPESSEIGLFQQNEEFGQRDVKGFWTKKLSKETRLNIKDCVDRSHRILNKQQKGDKDWRYGEIGEVCFGLQAPKEKHRHIYFDPKRTEVAAIIAKEFYPDQPSMLANSFPVSQRVANRQGSNALEGRADRQIGRRYTGPVDPHSVVDRFKVRGMDSSPENRAKVGKQLGIQGTPGSAEFNTALLRRLA